VPGKRLFKMLSEYYKENMIEDLPIPYCAVAADVNTGEEVRFSSGRVVDSVRASVAIPGVFTPFEYEGRFLVDGAIVNPVPVNIVREMGADVVIAVDLNSCTIEGGAKSLKNITSEGHRSSKLKKIKDEERDKRIFEMLEEKYKEFTGSFKGKFGSFRPKKHHPNILEILDKTTHIMQKSITENQFRISSPEIVIEPQLGDFRLFDFDRAEEAIEEGYRLTRDRVENIKLLGL